MATFKGNPIAVITGTDRGILARMIAYADQNGLEVKIAAGNEGIVVKVGGGMWTAQLGENDKS